jgi:hypothetical protein
MLANVQEDEQLLSESPTAAAGCGSSMHEVIEDGIDEGAGQKILNVLKRSSLQGLLLVMSRWQDHGATPGLDLYGTQLYVMLVERCKDLIANLKQAMGLNEEKQKGPPPAQEKPPHKHFDLVYLPPLPEPRVPTKFGPNHFLSDTPLNRPKSLPSLFSGGDVRLWMANDQCLRHLPESELHALKSIRQPDTRVEKVLHAVALLRGQSPSSLSGPAAARWGHLLQVLRSQTLRTELMLFDANTVSLETAQEVFDMLHGLEVEDIRRANHGAACLFEWAVGVARWRLAPPAAEQDGMPPPPTSLMPLQPKDAELSPIPQQMMRRGMQLSKKSSPVARRCFDRSRSAALMGMTML